MTKPGRHPEIRLDWRRTALPGATDDYVATIDPGTYCRVHIVVGGPQDARWWWAAAAGGYNAGTGYEDTAEEAAIAAETAMRRLQERQRVTREKREAEDAETEK